MLKLSKEITLFDTERHDRKKFDCGNSELNNYLKRYLSQNVKKNLVRAYVASELETGRILGYYTLSSASVSHNDIDNNELIRLPRYPIPAILIGRLASDIQAREQGLKLGGKLLIHALMNALAVSKNLGVTFVIVDTKEGAKSFYQHYGFRPLNKGSNQLFLKLSDIKKMRG